jgi:hypothetical protein
LIAVGCQIVDFVRIDKIRITANFGTTITVWKICEGPLDGATVRMGNTG